jgi:hypothetical protein
LGDQLNPERLADPASVPCRDLIAAGVHLRRLDLDATIVGVSERHGDIGCPDGRLWI